MPSVSQLPASLATFGRRHALEISDARWGFDAGRLVESIEKIGVAKADDSARIAAAALAAEEARVVAEAAAADAAAAEIEAAEAEKVRLTAEAKATEDSRLAANSAAAEEARIAEEARVAEQARLATAAAAAAAAGDARLAAEAAAAEQARAAADEEARAAAAATSAAAIGSVGSNEATPPVDPDAPTGTWPISATATTATQRRPGGRNLPRYAAPIAAVLVLALGLGTVVVGAGLLGGGAQASPSQAAVASPSLPVPSGVYVAVAGDTLASVAGKFGLTTAALVVANPGLSSSDVLPVGQIVVVPASQPDPTELQSSTPSASVTPSASAQPSGPPPSKAPPPTAIPKPPPPKDTTPPSNPKVTIKDTTAGNVYSKTVDLTLSATGATEMRVGNLVSGSCDWKDWRNYSKSYNDWVLSGTAGGSRTVCAQFRDLANPPNPSSIAKNSTYYDRKPTAVNWSWTCYVDDGATVDFQPFLVSTGYVHDSDPDGDPLHVVSATMTNGSGSVSRISNTLIRYTQSGATPREISFTWTIEDNHGGRDTGTFTLWLDFIAGCSGN